MSPCPDPCRWERRQTPTPERWLWGRTRRCTSLHLSTFIQSQTRQDRACIKDDRCSKCLESGQHVLRAVFEFTAPCLVVTRKVCRSLSTLRVSIIPSNHCHLGIESFNTSLRLLCMWNAIWTQIQCVTRDHNGPSCASFPFTWQCLQARVASSAYTCLAKSHVIA